MRLSVVDTNADGLDSKYIQHSNDVGFNFELARSLIYMMIMLVVVELNVNRI